MNIPKSWDNNKTYVVITNNEVYILSIELFAQNDIGMILYHAKSGESLEVIGDSISGIPANVPKKVSTLFFDDVFFNYWVSEIIEERNRENE